MEGDEEDRSGEGVGTGSALARQCLAWHTTVIWLLAQNSETRDSGAMRDVPYSIIRTIIFGAAAALDRERARTRIISAVVLSSRSKLIGFINIDAGVQKQVLPQIRTLRAMRRELETGSRLGSMRNAQVPLGLTEPGRQEGLDEMPRYSRSHSPAAYTNDVHVVILDALPGRVVIVDQPGAAVRNFVGTNRRPNSATTDRYAAFYLPSRHCLSPVE